MLFITKGAAVNKASFLSHFKSNDVSGRAEPRFIPAATSYDAPPEGANANAEPPVRHRPGNL